MAEANRERGRAAEVALPLRPVPGANLARAVVWDSDSWYQRFFLILGERSQLSVSRNANAVAPRLRHSACVRNGMTRRM